MDDKLNYIFANSVLGGQGPCSAMSVLACIYALALRSGRTPCYFKKSLDKCSEMFDDPSVSFTDTFPNLNNFFTEMDDPESLPSSLVGTQNFQALDDLATLIGGYDADLNLEVSFTPNYKIMRELEKEILDLFSLNESLLADMQKKLPQTTRSLVGVSFRLEYLSNYKKLDGKDEDKLHYLSAHKKHIALGPEYYTEAFGLFNADAFENGVDFLFFADDMPLAKNLTLHMRQEVRQKSHSQFFYADEGLNSFEGVCMLSLCDHVISSNSSFSFWGALLNKNSQKKVVCPRFYLYPPVDGPPTNGSWYPPTWHSLKQI